MVMSDTIILHCHSDKRMADQVGTWEFLSRVETRYTVYHYLCQGPYDYADAERYHWEGDHTLINIEHDMEPDDGMLEEMLACPEPLCGQAYWLSCLSTGRIESLICAFMGDSFMPIEFGDDRAQAMGLGRVKLTAEGRRALGTPARVKWNELDYEILRHIRSTGLLWHVHWPVCIHNHGFMRGENAKLKAFRQSLQSGASTAEHV